MKCNSSLDHFFLIEGSEWSCALIYFRPENLMRQKDVRTHTYGVRRICTHICSWSRNNDWTKLQLASNGPNFKHDLGQLKSSKKHRWTHFQASTLSQKKSHEFICFSNIGLILAIVWILSRKKKSFLQNISKLQLSRWFEHTLHPTYIPMRKNADNFMALLVLLN